VRWPSFGAATCASGLSPPGGAGSHGRFTGNLARMSVLTLDDLRLRRSEIMGVARRRGVVRIRVFGSIARGDASESSDIDFLVDLESGRSLLDLGGLLMDLRELLGHDVDVVTESGLRSRVAERVLADAVDL